MVNGLLGGTAVSGGSCSRFANFSFGTSSASRGKIGSRQIKENPRLKR